MKALHLGFMLVVTSVGWAQEIHNHPRDVHGVPGGVPDFCSQPTVTSVADGLWSNPATWSTGKIPASDARVAISTGRDIVYDVVSDTKLGCVEVRGRLRFQADADTRMKTANLMVMDEGYLEVGSASAPIAASVIAEIIIADQKIDRRLDPAELGAGIESLGRIRMHGAMKSPTFVRLAEEPLTGQTTLTLEQSVTGWKAGDHIVIPDTRQLRQGERGSNYKTQDEKVEIASIAGNQITLSAPLKYDHKDRKSTRLNSSHLGISYAVFCLKKKIIITDLKMPGVDGLTVVKDTRRLKADTTVIIITSISPETTAIDAVNISVSGRMTNEHGM